MATIGVSIKLVKRKTREIHAAIRVGCDRAAQETAEQMRDRAKELVPVKTGNLRGTLDASRTGDLEWTFSAGGATTESPEGADYALHVEMGTTSQPAKPYFIPAVEEYAPGFGAAVRRETELELRRVRS